MNSLIQKILIVVLYCIIIASTNAIKNDQKDSNSKAIAVSKQTKEVVNETYVTIFEHEDLKPMLTNENSRSFIEKKITLMSFYKIALGKIYN